jgi:hypothetical protein
MRGADNAFQGIFIVSLSILLSACSGAATGEHSMNSSAVPVVLSTSSAANADLTTNNVLVNSTARPVPVTLKYVLPANSMLSSVAQDAFAPQNIRLEQASSSFTGFTSTATTPLQISLSVNPLGGSATTATGSCTASSGGSSGICNIAFTTAPGANTLAGTIYAGANNVIASFTQVAIINPSGANSLNFTANPVVNKVMLQLATSSINAGNVADVVLSVNAQDINGNTIAGTAPYVDANGNSLTLNLSTTNMQGGRGTALTLKGPVSLTAPLQAIPYVHYDGTGLRSGTISVA